MEYFSEIVQKHRTTKPTCILLVQKILHRKEESVVLIEWGIERFLRAKSISFVEL